MVRSRQGNTSRFTSRQGLNASYASAPMLSKYVSIRYSANLSIDWLLIKIDLLKVRLLSIAAPIRITNPRSISLCRHHHPWVRPDLLYTWNMPQRCLNRHRSSNCDTIVNHHSIGWSRLFVQFYILGAQSLFVARRNRIDNGSLYFILLYFVLGAPHYIVYPVKNRLDHIQSVLISKKETITS